MKLGVRAVVKVPDEIPSPRYYIKAKGQNDIPTSIICDRL